MMRVFKVVRGTIAIVMMLAFLASCAPAMLAGSGVSAISGMNKEQPQSAKPTGSVGGSKRLSAFSEKSVYSERLGVLHPGDTVVIEQESDNWSQVTFENRRGRTITGWIPSSYIEKDKKDLSGMKARTTVEGTLTGAAVGAAAGAIVAAMIGVNPARGAAIGAMIGTPLGLAAGVYVANQKEKYATEEQYLDACIAESRQYNEEARKDIEYMQNYIAGQEIRITKLKRQIAASASKKGLARAQLKDMTAKKQGMDKVITSLEGEASAQQKAINSTTKDPDRIAQLQKEVQRTQESIARFKKQRNELASVMAKTQDLTL